MWGNEWRKLCRDRFVPIALLVLLAVNAVMTYWYAASETKVDVRAYREAFALYETDPEAFAEKMEESAQFTDWESDAAKQFIMYYTVTQQANYPEQYREQLSVIVRNAERTLREYDAMRMKESSYLYQKQETYRSIYTELSDIELGFSYIRGWDLLFSGDFTVGLAAFFLLLAVPRLLSYETEYGFAPVARATLRGRGRLLRVKLSVAIVVTVLSVVLFTASSMLSIALVTGFSPLSDSAHLLSRFVFLPFDWTVGELFAATVGARLLSMLCLSALCTFLYGLTRSYYGTVLGGIALLALDFVFGTKGGLVYLARPTQAFSIYNCVNLFTHCATVLYLLIATVLLSTFLLFAGGFLLALRRTEHRTFGKLSFCPASFGAPKTLFGQELKKLFFKRKALLLLLAALLLRCGISTWVYAQKPTAAEYFYKQYMETLAGELTDGKVEFVAQETAYRENLMRLDESMLEAYPEEERDALRQEAMASPDRLVALKRIEEQILYVRHTEGAYLLADTGWQALFAREFDYIFYAVLILLAAGTVADECDCGFLPVLRASRHGRGRTYGAKTAAMLLFAGILYAGCTVCDWLCFSRVYSLPCAEFPAQSVSALSFSRSVDLYTFCITDAVCGALTALCFTLACIGVSALCKQSRAAGTLLLAVVFVPFAADKLGLSIAGYVSVAKLTSLAQYSVLCGDFTLRAVATAVTAMLAVAVYWCGFRALEHKMR